MAKIRYISSLMVGAPTVSNAISTLIGAFDAALVTGINVKSPSSASIASGVMTIQYSASHGYNDLVYLRCANGSVPLANGDFQATFVNVTTLTVPVPGAPDGAVTGLETRVAPLGWEKPFGAGTTPNVAVYRSTNLTTPRHYVRLRDDAVGPSTADLRGYEAMSDDSNGTGVYPPLTVTNTPIKSTTSTPGNWFMVGDDKSFHFFIAQQGSAGGFYHCGAGAFASRKVGDAFNSFVKSSGSQGNSDRLRSASGVSSGTGTGQVFFPRPHQGIGSPTAADHAMAFAIGGVGVYPSAVDNGTEFFGPIYLRDTSAAGTPLRGHFLGMLGVTAPIPSCPEVILSGIDGITGRAVVAGMATNGNAPLAFPLDQDWD